jgi:hypothetical protein
MENTAFIDDCLIKTSIYRGFSIATLDYQRKLPASETLSAT